jgi:hypothetical protein
VAWHLVVDGTSVEVGGGRRDDADRITSSDYESTLPIARTIYRDHPEIVAALRERERHSAPPAAARPALPKQLRAALMEFHDHMARHTA